MPYYTIMASQCRHDGLCRQACQWTLIWDGRVPSRSRLAAAVHFTEQRWARVRVFKGTNPGRLIYETKETASDGHHHG